MIPGFDNFMSGDGGYSLQGGMASSGGSFGDKTNNQTVNFSNPNSGQNTALIVGAVIVVAILLKGRK